MEVFEASATCSGLQLSCFQCQSRTAGVFIHAFSFGQSLKILYPASSNLNSPNPEAPTLCCGEAKLHRREAEKVHDWEGSVCFGVWASGFSGFEGA